MWASPTGLGPTVLAVQSSQSLMWLSFGPAPTPMLGLSKAKPAVQVSQRLMRLTRAGLITAAGSWPSKVGPASTAGLPEADAAEHGASVQHAGGSHGCHRAGRGSAQDAALLWPRHVGPGCLHDPLKWCLHKAATAPRQMPCCCLLECGHALPDVGA